MSITSFINKIAVQDAVYWGNPVNDGFGGYTFDTPVVIKCRWEDMERVYTGQEGQQIQQKAKVIVTQEIDIRGWLMLGTLNDLAMIDSGTYVNPSNEIKAYQIVGVDKVPMIKSNTIFVHIVYLGFGNMY